MRPLKRRQAVIEDKDDGLRLCLPLPSLKALTANSLMEPPSLPPPFKRSNSNAGAYSPVRLLTPRVSWADLASASFDSNDGFEKDGFASPPSTPTGPLARHGSMQFMPPSPPSLGERRARGLAVCRRRPPSDDEGMPPEKELERRDVNDGRFAREFAKVSVIGKGQFSTVFRAQHKVDQCFYAVKRTTKISRNKHQLREVFALASVAVEAEGCPNIVRYFSSWLEDECLHIQTELCDCSLRDRLTTRRQNGADSRFSEEEVLQTLRDVSNGLKVLHGQGYVHLDIKPDNILIKGDCLKLADLGLAAAALGAACDDICEGDCRYLAKEVLRGDFSALPKADVFSLGLVCYELATNPTEGLPCNGEEWQGLRIGCLPHAELLCLSQPVVDLLTQMVATMPEQRPSIVDVAQHPDVACDSLTALREQVKARTSEAEKNKRLADEYFSELMSMKRQELLNGSSTLTNTSRGERQYPFASSRPVATPAFAAEPTPRLKRSLTAP